MHRYHIEDRIGEGNFGSVLRATFIETGQQVAIKKITVCRIQDGIPNNTLREIKALQLLQTGHPNIIKLYEVFPFGSSVALVMELMATDLASIVRASRRALPEATAKSYFVMLLRALQHCHAHNVIHRDVKPGNCLIARDGLLKLGDFGLARLYLGDGRPMTHEVATRWYRAPELLFGARHYGPAVDMWAAGCVLAEMLLAMPVFPGDGDLGQINKIFLTLGTPDEASWPGLHALPDWNKVHFLKVEGAGLPNVLCNASPEAVELLQKLLRYDPGARYTAAEALADGYFLTEPLPLQPDLTADLMDCRCPLLELAQPKALLKSWEYEEFVHAPFAWPVSPRHQAYDSDEDACFAGPASPPSSDDDRCDAEAQVIPIIPYSSIDA